MALFMLSTRNFSLKKILAYGCVLFLLLSPSPIATKRANAIQPGDAAAWIAAATSGMLLLDKFANSKLIEKLTGCGSSLWNGLISCCTSCCQKQEKPSIMRRYLVNRDLKEDLMSLLEVLGRSLHRDVEAAIKTGEAASENITENNDDGTTFTYTFPNRTIDISILGSGMAFQNLEDYSRGLANNFQPITDMEDIIQKIYSRLDIPEFKSLLDETVTVPERRNRHMSRLRKMIEKGELKVLEKRSSGLGEDPQMSFLVGYTSLSESVDSSTNPRPIFVHQVSIIETNHSFDAADMVGTCERSCNLYGRSQWYGESSSTEMRGTPLSPLASRDGHGGDNPSTSTTGDQGGDYRRQSSAFQDVSHTLRSASSFRPSVNTSGSLFRGAHGRTPSSLSPDSPTLRTSEVRVSITPDDPSSSSSTVRTDSPRRMSRSSTTSLDKDDD